MASSGGMGIAHAAVDSGIEPRCQTVPENLSIQALRYAHLRGYLVAPDGRLVAPSGLLRKTRIDSAGYPSFTVTIRVENRARRVPVRVHRLAALQKFGEQMFDPGLEVRHRDENRANPRPDNLLLGTRQDNANDRDPVACILQGQHSQDGRRSLNYAQADRLRACRRRGMSYGQLAAKFGCNVGTAWFICHDRTYVRVARPEALHA